MKTQLKITFTPAVFKRFPKMQVVFLLAKKIDNQTHLKESQEILKDISALVQQTFHPDTLKTHHLISPWAVAREEFGAQARHYQTSLEHLLNRVLSRKNIAASSTVTNLVNFIALKHFVPLAVDDLKKVQGNLTFNLDKGDIFYADEKTILGKKLDFWKNTKTQPTAKTKKVLIHFEALPPVKTEKIKEITAELAGLLKDFCGGEVSGVIIDKKKKWTRLY